MTNDVMVRVSGENELKFNRIKEKIENDVGKVSNARVFIAALNHYYDELFGDQDLKDSKPE